MFRSSLACFEQQSTGLLHLIVRVRLHIGTTPPTFRWGVDGASDVTRTRDLLITSEMHYRLCYTSVVHSLIIISVLRIIVN